MHSKCQALTLRGANKIKRRNYRQQCRRQSATAPGMHSGYACVHSKIAKGEKTPPQDCANTPTQQFIIITVTNKNGRARDVNTPEASAFESYVSWKVKPAKNKWNAHSCTVRVRLKSQDCHAAGERSGRRWECAFPRWRQFLQKELDSDPQFVTRMF